MFEKLINRMCLLKKRITKENYGRCFVINSILLKKRKAHYLEIGVRKGTTIVRVDADYKVGVDPVLQLEKIAPKLKKKLKKSKNITFYEEESDTFFRHNDLKFDVILIDGLHVYEQALRDIVNALNCLNDKGFVVVHDCNPQSEKAQSRTEIKGLWNGDVWKAIYAIKIHYEKINYFILDTDHGLGILTKQDNKEKYTYQHDERILHLPYNALAKDRKNILNLQKKEKFFDFLKTLNYTSSNNTRAC